MLSGYKTYIVAALWAAVAFAESLGLLDSGAAEQARAFLVAAGLAAVRAAIAGNGTAAKR
jgi:hypothetical protein